MNRIFTKTFKLLLYAALQVLTSTLVVEKYFKEKFALSYIFKNFSKMELLFKQYIFMQVPRYILFSQHLNAIN